MRKTKKTVRIGERCSLIRSLYRSSREPGELPVESNGAVNLHPIEDCDVSLTEGGEINFGELEEIGACNPLRGLVSANY